ncbi:amino acid adenylation domain-containing protein [Streptomyces sp. NPDC057580]|uniref:amino acid adenylation domain-containing protein n=1 Tax=Streptomyces sp. NPDC057580 TaxID=3346173 RepID=UPI00367712E9
MKGNSVPHVRISAGEETSAGVTAGIIGMLEELTDRSGIEETDVLESIGLSSIMAARLLLEIHDRYGVDLPLDRLDRSSTVAALAGAVAGGPGAPPGRAGGIRQLDVPVRPPGRPGGAEEFPLTSVQQSYVVGKHPQLSPDTVGCHHYREFTLADTDVDRLRNAWRTVLGHHAMLRVVVAGTRQRIGDGGTWDITAHDRRSGSRADFDAHVASVRNRMSHRCYPPGMAPLFAIEVSHGPGGLDVVHLSIDGLVTDGYGLELLLDHWGRCYHDPGTELPVAGISAQDCAWALEEHRGTAEFAADVDYWTTRLREIPAAPDVLAADRPPSGGELSCHRREPLGATLAPEQWQALRKKAAAWEVSPTSLVLTVFGEALQRAGGGPEFLLVLTTSDRVRLPAATAELVAPLTSTMLLPARPDPARPLAESAAATHRGLWEGFGHSSASGIEVIRAVGTGRRGSAAPRLPVVFTSMLDLRPKRHDEGFGRQVSYAVGQTSGVALDHQMWEEDGSLRVRWDLVPELFAPGAGRTLFADFMGALVALADPEEAEERALNELQQGYLVDRLAGAREGCQVYQSFRLDSFDPERLETAWLRLVESTDALRTDVTPGGKLRIRAHTPRSLYIPVLPAEAAQRLPQEMTARPFQPGRWPLWDLRITGGEDGGPAVLHLAVDLLAADGLSIQLIGRRLMRLLHGAEPPDPGTPPAPQPPPARDTRAEEHWRARAAALPPGPAPLDTGGPRTRLEGVRTGWRAAAATLRDEGLRGDPVLLGALTEALTGLLPDPYPLEVVRWPQAPRPAEHTALSLLPAEPRLPSHERAAHYQRILDEDTAADTASALTGLRGVRTRPAPTLPVVLTSAYDVTGTALPAGVTPGPGLTSTPGVALDCIVTVDGDRLHYCWDVASSAFDPQALAEAFAAFGDLVARIGDVPDRTQALHPVVREANDTAVDFPAAHPVHRLFEDQARRRPDAEAVRRRMGPPMTYGELNRRANRIAWRLRDLGVGPGTAVGIALPRTPDLVAAVFGVLKAGGTYVPVEPQLPPERAESIRADAAVAIVLVAGPEQRRWPAESPVTTVDVTALAEDIRERTDPPAHATPSDTAYVIFTSGSSGRPKGVAVTHRAVLNLLNWCYRTWEFAPGDLGMCVTSLGFDLSVFDILGLLGRGAALYLADEAQQHDPDLLLRALVEEPVTFWNSAPTTLAQLAPRMAAHADHPGTGTLRLVFLSGDYTPLSLPDEVRAVFPGARIVSLGGATEATVWSNFFPVDEVDPQWRSIPYGKPIDNARYYVLDEELRPCEPGTEGDLFIAGECLSQGYYRRPELTAERFVDDPFAARAGERMYRTGDRALHRPDGHLVFLGRSDGQVKIRGFRVELEEIEHRLRLHPDVRDAVVVVRSQNGDSKLVAHVIPANGTMPAVRDLRAFAARTLPDYMVPNYVEQLTEFPATANGKLDRAALARPPAAPQTTPAAPATAAGVRAEDIAEVFAGLLGLDTLDPTADLWDSGASSFTMVQASALIEERYGRRTEVAVLLAEATCISIARHLSATPEAADAVAPPAAQDEPAPPPAPNAPDEPAVARAEPGTVPQDIPEALERPTAVDFFSPEDRELFKSAGHATRHAPARSVLPLADVGFAEEVYAGRSTQRDFDSAPLPAESLARLLGLLRRTTTGGRPRYLYPSAGDTYAVQAYVRVRPGRVTGVEGGVHYYRPDRHELELITPEPDFDRTAHVFYNRPVFDKAAFELFLIGQRDGITPLYGQEADLYLALEAGYIGQLLTGAQAACGIGLCPVGSLNFDTIRAEFGLDEGHRLLHTFIGGTRTGHESHGAAPQYPATVPDRGAATRSGRATTRPRTESRPADAPRAVDDIAVLGAAGRFPGADDLDTYWRNLAAGHIAIGPPPASRRAALGQHAPDAGYLRDTEAFDSLLFHISPTEARTLDPQTRLTLQAVWECLEDAGLTAASLRATAPRTGVFTGAMWQDHQHTGADAWRRGERAEIFGGASEIPNRISHHFGLTGPSIAVDTSCSSSLTALHLAVRSLRSGECDAAVVTGASLVSHPYHLALLEDGGLLRSAGVPGAFSADSSGWIPGEGIGALLLRPRPADGAESGGVPLRGIIETTWTGHIGGAGRYGSANAEALTASIGQTLHGAGLDPGDIGYVECAAAGASIADAAEITALGEIFRTGGRPLVGTVKPGIGHLEAAAGLSQLIKVLLQFEHRRIAPTVRAASLSPLIGFERVQLADTLRDWEPLAPGAPLRALVNVTGASGTLGHAVLRSVPGQS